MAGKTVRRRETSRSTSIQPNNIWHSAGRPDPLTWSPGYEVLMSPFVATLGREQGYKIWRFLVFGGITLLTYFAFIRTLKSIWLGLIIALYVQLLIEPYTTPALQSCTCLVLLLCLLLLSYGTRYLGLVFGLLLNSILITGAITSLLASFSILCLFFYARRLWSRRFVFQLLIGVGVFACFIIHYSYDLSQYPAEALRRGQAGLYHQLSLYIQRSGRSVPYLQPGEDDPTRGVDEYHRHLAAIDRYYVANWGAKEIDLRASIHDKRWPAFLLDWPWMMSKDPKLMKEYGSEVLRTLEDSLRLAFQIAIPFGKYNPNARPSAKNGYALIVVIAFVIPSLVRLIRRRLPLSSVEWPSRLQLFFLLSSLSILVPLTLVMPLEIYFPPLIPCFLSICALVGIVAIKTLERFRSTVEASPQAPSTVNQNVANAGSTRARKKGARRRTRTR